MREIKFRVWDKKNSIMEYGINLFSAYTDESGFKWISGNMGVLFSEDDKEGLEFMQFTGLKDKNDKEIFEGDIVKTSHSQVGDAKPVLVFWDDKLCGFSPFPENELDEYSIGEYDKNNCEVIGNTYENPKLLTMKGGAKNGYRSSRG